MVKLWTVVKDTQIHLKVIEQFELNVLTWSVKRYTLIAMWSIHDGIWYTSTSSR